MVTNESSMTLYSMCINRIIAIIPRIKENPNKNGKSLLTKNVQLYLPITNDIYWSDKKLRVTTIEP